MEIVLGRLGEIKVGGSPSGKELTSEVQSRTSVLARSEIGKGSVVALSQQASPNFFHDLLAVWSRGATAVCLDPQLTVEERRNVVRFAGAEHVLLCADTIGDDWPIHKLVLSEVLHNAGGGERSASNGPNDAALVLFTSGTTGEPKGVVHSFGSLAARLSLNTAAIGLKSSDRVLLTLPVHFGHGLIGNALSPMFAGAKLFVPPMGLPLAARLGEIIDEEAITFLTSVPALWRMAMKLSKRPRNGTLRRVHVGSAPASVDFLREIENWAGCEVYNCYGITEAANWISGASVRDPNMRDGFVGQPWGGTASVIDRAGNRQSVGEGEIIIQTPSLMTGYLRRPDLTAEVLFNGWYRTGDWGYVDEQGSMCLQGRIKEEINRAGFKVQPAEIDLLLEKHPEVEEACTFGIPDPVSHEIVAVAVRLTTGSSQTQKSLRAWCLERLRKDAVPERWFFTDEIPKTARGKLRRDAVRRKFVVSGNSNS